MIEKIQQTNHDGFPVVDGSAVVGYIAARDLLFVKLGETIEQAMSGELIVADPEMDITDAARVIFRSGIQKLPVVDEKNHLLGIISNSDVIRSQIEHVSPEKVFNFMTTLKKLYSVDPTLNRPCTHQGSAPHPVQDLRGRTGGQDHEIKKGLAEPIIVVKRPGGSSSWTVTTAQ